MYNHILVPVAPDQIDECAESLEAAHRLLAKGGKVSVLSVLEELPSYVGSYFPKEQIKNSISEFENTLKTKLSTDDIDTHVISGHPTNSILEWAKKKKIDCIVVSSHRPGFSDLLLGSTAARIVRHANCSVVVQR
ncbi:universal stress protein [Ruegeria lacuscaerulensis]|uniref:universal stress protein n=1 Tax=Ruegeria lacuscaerulensis TaxID=55218 RepID=UPI00147ABB1B|nr:universal stress protein [Ruegeria lacuscaerulensis]